MRIVHKYTKQETGVTYRYWKKDILKNHLEDNYEILSKPDLVDIYMVNSENGKLTFVETTDRTVLEEYFLKGKNYTAKETDLSKFDEMYRLKENQSDLLNKTLTFSKITPKLNAIKNQILNSTISKTLGKILGNLFVWIGGIMGSILVLIIWKKYEIELTELWNKYFIFNF